MASISNVSTVLPNDVLFEIFSHGDIADLLACGKVCKQWRKAAENNTHWSRFFPHYTKPLTSKQEVFSHFDGAITSETQLLKRLEKFIKEAPLGQWHTFTNAGGIHCVFPFNPECALSCRLSDEKFIQEKKRQELGRRSYVEERRIPQLKDSKQCVLVFAKALPNKRAVKKELALRCQTQFPRSGWNDGLAYHDNLSCQEVVCPGGLIKSISFFAEKRYFHYTNLVSSIQTDSKDFNKTLEETTKKAVEERTQAIDAKKIRRNEMILAASVAIVASGVFAVCQFFFASEEQS